MPGTVVNRAGLPLPGQHYDLLVVGGGLLGLALAFYLRKFSPERSLLVVEQDGIPSEAGASWASPGIAVADGPEARWALKALERLEEETGLRRERSFHRVGFLDFGAEGGTALEDLPLEASRRDAIRALLGVHAESAVYHPAAGFGSAEGAALHYGHAAVKRGADLLLNSRLEPLGGSRYRLERLEYDRFMRPVVASREVVVAEIVVFAAGASTPALVEKLSGVMTPYRLAYRQYPRLEHDLRLPLEGGRVDLPVLRIQGFTLRPQGEGLLVVPPPLPSDPAGYQPKGGELMGVRMGVRRELLELFLEHAEELPFLSWERFNLGKTLANVRGAWDVVTPEGKPGWRPFGEGCYALVGGIRGFDLGLAAAYDLAATLSNRPERPWD